MSTTRSASPKAPATEPARAALLICSHGVGGRPGAAEAHARMLGRRGAFAEVRACCLRGRPGLDEALRAAPAGRVVIAPFLMSGGWARRVLAEAAHAAASDLGRRIMLAPPVGERPGLAALAESLALEACGSLAWSAAGTNLVLAAHGNPADASSFRAARAQAMRIAGRGRFPRVATAFLDQPPGLAEVLARLGPGPTVVVGLFADAGPHGRGEVARLLGRAAGPVAYAGPVGVQPGMAELVLEAVAEVAPLRPEAPDPVPVRGEGAGAGMSHPLPALS
jgi:sirohydrochlorin ferrochelatase